MTDAGDVGAAYDLAVVGAGIVGLGHALAAVDRGLRVVVLDRGTSLTGSTVRNFGHIGTSVHAGEAAEYAERARELWLRLADEAGLWMRRSGTLIVARSADELAVLDEGLDRAAGSLLSADEVGGLAPVVGAVGGALLPRDLQVDPRTAGPAIARYLEGRGVRFLWRTAALGVETGVVHTGRGDIRAAAVVVAVNFDVDQLFPSLAEQHGVERCGLDMLLVDGVGLGLPVLTGSSLLRYSGFSGTAAAAALRAGFESAQPELLARDVNEMYTERPDGGLIVGDTHYRGTAIAPFQDEAAFELMHGLAGAMFGRELRVRERWQGVYASAPHDFLRAAPADGVRVVSVTTGIGMTTGLGVADAVITELLGAPA